MNWLGREFSDLGFCDDSVEPLGCRTENLFSMGYIMILSVIHSV